MRTLLAILLSGVGAGAREPIDTGKLPMPAERKVDFATDILPLLERSCLKCHGDKRPKSDYRLTSRESALNGGELGVAICPVTAPTARSSITSPAWSRTRRCRRKARPQR